MVRTRSSTVVSATLLIASALVDASAIDRRTGGCSEAVGRMGKGPPGGGGYGHGGGGGAGGGGAGGGDQAGGGGTESGGNPDNSGEGGGSVTNAGQPPSQNGLTPLELKQESPPGGAESGGLAFGGNALQEHSAFISDIFPPSQTGLVPPMLKEGGPPGGQSSDIGTPPQPLSSVPPGAQASACAGGSDCATAKQVTPPDSDVVQCTGQCPQFAQTFEGCMHETDVDACLCKTQDVGQSCAACLQPYADQHADIAGAIEKYKDFMTTATCPSGGQSNNVNANGTTQAGNDSIQLTGGLQSGDSPLPAESGFVLNGAGGGESVVTRTRVNTYGVTVTESCHNQTVTDANGATTVREVTLSSGAAGGYGLASATSGADALQAGESAASAYSSFWYSSYGPGQPQMTGPAQPANGYQEGPPSGAAETPVTITTEIEGSTVTTVLPCDCTESAAAGHRYNGGSAAASQGNDLYDAGSAAHATQQTGLSDTGMPEGFNSTLNSSQALVNAGPDDKGGPSIPRNSSDLLANNQSLTRPGSEAWANGTQALDNAHQTFINGSQALGNGSHVLAPANGTQALNDSHQAFVNGSQALGNSSHVLAPANGTQGLNDSHQAFVNGSQALAYDSHILALANHTQAFNGSHQAFVNGSEALANASHILTNGSQAGNETMNAAFNASSFNGTNQFVPDASAASLSGGAYAGQEKSAGASGTADGAPTITSNPAFAADASGTRMSLTAPITTVTTDEYGASTTTVIPCGCSADHPQETGADAANNLASTSTSSLAAQPCDLPHNGSMAANATQNAKGILSNGTCVPSNGTKNKTSHTNSFSGFNSSAPVAVTVSTMLSIAGPLGALLAASSIVLAV